MLSNRLFNLFLDLIIGLKRPFLIKDPSITHIRLHPHNLNLGDRFWRERKQFSLVLDRLLLFYHLKLGASHHSSGISSSPSLQVTSLLRLCSARPLPNSGNAPA